MNSNHKSILTTARQPEKSSLLATFTNGVVADAQLYQQEIRVQKAWAQALQKMKLLSREELVKIEDALNKASELIFSNNFDWRISDEDIHMNLERFVNEETNGLGKKMHAGRSRNDLIATTLRLHVADSAQEILELQNDLIATLIQLAQKHLDIIIPGMTHLQNGQPIRWSQALLGHAWAIKRDVKKLVQIKKNSLSTMPLGSAALAGTALPVDLNFLSHELGFESVPTNSYDLVGDRDSIIEILQSLALFGAHLSRLAEDIIYWASAPVRLVKLSPNWSTGSSIMPNKRNPDVAELARGKAALWMGDASGALTLVKGLATCYGSDLHEIKIPYLRVISDVKLTLKVFKYFVEELIPDQSSSEMLLNFGHILATEIADELTQQGTPFRESYAIVAALVELAESKKLQVHELKNQDCISVTPLVTEQLLQKLSFENSVEKRAYSGGTARAQILKQIELLKV